MSTTPYYRDEASGMTIYHADCRAVLATLPEGSADIILTDPPYSEHVHGKSRRVTGQWRDKFPAAADNRVRDLGFVSLSPDLMAFCAGEFARLAKRWVLVFSDVEMAGDWRKALTGAGLDYVRTGAWVKLHNAPQFTGDRPAPGFEAVTIAHRPGKKRWDGGGKSAVWTYPIVMPGNVTDPRVHTTQKPLGLLRELVGLFSEPGETILDPFLGSGTTMRAAKDLGRRCIGIEMSEAYCRVAARRLRQSVLPLAPSA